MYQIISKQGPYDYDNYDDGDVMDDLQEEEKINKMKKTHFTDLKPDDLQEDEKIKGIWIVWISYINLNNF